MAASGQRSSLNLRSCAKRNSRAWDFRGNMPVAGALTAFWEPNMNSIVYLVGLIVIVLAILSFVGIG